MNGGSKETQNRVSRFEGCGRGCASLKLRGSLCLHSNIRHSRSTFTDPPLSLDHASLLMATAGAHGFMASCHCQLLIPTRGDHAGPASVLSASSTSGRLCLVLPSVLCRGMKQRWGAGPEKEKDERLVGWAQSGKEKKKKRGPSAQVEKEGRK